MKVQEKSSNVEFPFGKRKMNLRKVPKRDKISALMTINSRIYLYWKNQDLRTFFFLLVFCFFLLCTDYSSYFTLSSSYFFSNPEFPNLNLHPFFIYLYLFGFIFLFPFVYLFFVYSFIFLSFIVLSLPFLLLPFPWFSFYTLHAFWWNIPNFNSSQLVLQ